MKLKHHQIISCLQYRRKTGDKMKIAKIGWHSFSFHCKFCQKSGSHYYCCNRNSETDGKECHVDICPMFKNAEEKAAPVQQTTSDYAAALQLVIQYQREVNVTNIIGLKEWLNEKRLNSAKPNCA